MQAHVSSNWTLGRFQVDLAQRRVYDAGEPLDLSYKAFEALLAMIEARGEAVSKDDLLGRLWPGQTVDESNLTKVVAQLRKALDRGGESLVETVPRTGYRLRKNLVPAVIEFPRIEAPSEPRRAWRRHAAWCAAAALLATASLAGYRAWDRKLRTEETERLSVEAGNLLSTWDVRNYPAAAANYKRIIALAVEPHAGYWGLAHVALRQGGQKQYALDMLTKAIQLKPDSCGAHGLLGYTLIIEHLRLRDAARQLDEARRLCPHSPGIANWWTTLATAQGRAAEALSVYQSIAADAPASNSKVTTIASLLYFSGRFEDAIHASFESERAAPSPNSLIEWRGRSYLELGRTAEAVQAFTAGPFSEFAPETRAALAKHGPAAALEVLLRATASEPHRLQHSYRRAHWLLALGKKNEALAELEFGFGPRPFYYWLAADPAFEPLRGNPRFQALAARLKN